MHGVPVLRPVMWARGTCGLALTPTLLCGAGNVPTGVVGICEDMCPAEELAQRRRIEDIAQLERLRPDQRTTDASMAVKKFSRNVRLPAPDLASWRPTPGSLPRCIRGCGAAPRS